MLFGYDKFNHKKKCLALRKKHIKKRQNSLLPVMATRLFWL
jgi:hypothetical protein